MLRASSGDVEARFRQLRRWAHGHNRAFATNLVPLLRSRKVTARQKATPHSAFHLLRTPDSPERYRGQRAALLYGRDPRHPRHPLRVYDRELQRDRQFAPVFEVGAAELLDGARERTYFCRAAVHFSLQQLGGHVRRDRCLRRLAEVAPPALGQDPTRTRSRCSCCLAWRSSRCCWRSRRYRRFARCAGPATTAV